MEITRVGLISDTHSMVRKDGVLYINPGSAGPKRSGHPVTLAVLEITSGKIQPQIINLDGVGLDGVGLDGVELDGVELDGFS